MNVVVPRRVSGPADRGTVTSLYGKGNTSKIRQPLGRGQLNQLNRVGVGSAQGGVSPQNTAVNRTPPPQSTPVNRAAPPQSTPVNRTPPPQSTPVNRAAPVQSTPVNRAAPVQNTPAAKPAFKRNRAPARGAELMRGQKWQAAGADGKIPQSLRICVGWEISDSRCELDASAFMLGSNDRVPGDEWFIFYGQTESPDKSVRYRSNADNRNAPDDAELIIEPFRVSPQITKIAVCVTIYEAVQKRLNFGMVNNLYARMVDGSGNELGRFLLKDCSSAVTAMVVGEFYRYKDTWKFNAVGSGVNRDLASFCGMYGVNLE